MYRAKADGFHFLPSYYEAIRNLSDADRLVMYDAVLDYAFGNVPERLPSILQGLLTLIIGTLDES